MYSNVYIIILHVCLPLEHHIVGTPYLTVVYPSSHYPLVLHFLQSGLHSKAVAQV